MKTYAVGTVNVAQQTRHARRIYVGGIPPNLIDEDGLRSYINAVVAQGLGEENDHSYVLSVYINHKKCFAFVELKSIELATACLALDGIMMKNVALRILRANEYKPELVPAAMNKVIHFDLSGFQFGNPVSSSGGLHHTESDEGFTDRSFDSLIQSANFLSMEPGTVVLLGYPYDETPKKAVVRGAGSTAMPKTLRNLIRKFKFGAVDNAEYGSDMSKLRVLDVGDILGGKQAEEGRTNLTMVLSELLQRGGVPFVIGGSNDLVYPSWKSAVALSKVPVSIVSLGSRVEPRILDDLVQLSSADETGAESKSPEVGTYVLFGAQGSSLSSEEARSFVSKGGRLCWLLKELRRQATPLDQQFQRLLDELTVAKAASEGTELVAPAVVLHIDCGSLESSVAAFSNNTSSTVGFKYDEVLQIAYLAGLSPAVAMVQVTEFSPAAEETRQNMLVLEVLYYFCMGYSLRVGGSTDGFVSPLGVAAPRADDLKAASSVESDFAHRLTSMVPPSAASAVAGAADGQSQVAKLADEVAAASVGGSVASSAASRAAASHGHGADLDAAPIAGSAMSAALQHQQGLQQQQQQQQQTLNRYAGNVAASASNASNLRQQMMMQSGGASMRGEQLTAAALAASANAPGGANAAYGRTFLEMKVASGQIPYLQPGASPSDGYFAGANGGPMLSQTPTRPGMISSNSGRGLGSSASSTSMGAPPIGISATLSRSTSSRSQASSQASTSNSNIVFGNLASSSMPNGSRSNVASFSGSSSHASSAQSMPSVLNANVHSLAPSPNTSSSLLPPPHPHLPIHAHSPHHHVVRRGLYMQESQSSVDFGHDPHPFDESTDLNFDVSSSAMAGHHAHHSGGGGMSGIGMGASSNSMNGSFLGGSPGGFKLPSGPAANLGNDFMLLNASTKSNAPSSSGIGFSSSGSASADTAVAGANYPQLMPYLSSMDSPPYAQQQQLHAGPGGFGSLMGTSLYAQGPGGGGPSASANGGGSGGSSLLGLNKPADF